MRWNFIFPAPERLLLNVSVHSLSWHSNSPRISPTNKVNPYRSTYKPLWAILILSILNILGIPLKPLRMALWASQRVSYRFSPQGVDRTEKLCLSDYAFSKKHRELFWWVLNLPVVNILEILSKPLRGAYMASSGVSYGFSPQDNKEYEIKSLMR